jgi:hypothetical protein
MAAALLGALGLAGCTGAERPYNSAASIPCLRAEASTLLKPSRAAARELRHGPQLVRVAAVVRSGSTIGTKASGGDYQLVTYPSEEILYLHFAGSQREAASLLQGYRANFADQIGRGRADRLVYRRRNVIIEWDSHQPSNAEQRVVDRCLRTEPSRVRTHRQWRPAPHPQLVTARSSPPLQRMVPGDAEVIHAWRVPVGGGSGTQVLVEWRRTSLEYSPLDTAGLVLWRLSGRAAWTLARSVALAHDSDSVFARTGDANGDGRPDLLIFEDMGGSAGCGVYRLLATVRGRVQELLARPGCYDNTRIWARGGALHAYDGVVRDPRSGNQIHCCWKVWLETTMRWRGARLVAVAKRRVRVLPRALRRSVY